jgi:hypothetical protein
VRLDEHHQMMEAFSPSRANEALDVSVLPGRACRNWMMADAHSTDAASVRRPECTVAVTNQMTWHFAPRKGFGHLTCDPLCRWIAGDGDLDLPPSSVTKNHQAIE